MYNIDMWLIFQLFIVFWETFVRWRVTSSKIYKRRVGYTCGVIAQLWWLIVFVHLKQWGLMPLLLIDGLIWYRGIVHNGEKNGSKIN